MSLGDNWDKALKNNEEAIAGYIETLKILKSPYRLKLKFHSILQWNEAVNRRCEWLTYGVPHT
ncbi:MAG: type II toxin-antitoxin system HicB family antitoxin [Methanoregula sp.]|nr:type II toxin-antitoxin system HicB family antitoxin [Methanoregula sp.]